MYGERLTLAGRLAQAAQLLLHGLALAARLPQRLLCVGQLLAQRQVLLDYDGLVLAALLQQKPPLQVGARSPFLRYLFGRTSSDLLGALRHREGQEAHRSEGACDGQCWGAEQGEVIGGARSRCNGGGSQGEG